MMKLSFVTLLFSCLCLTVPGQSPQPEATGARLNVLVVTGGHSFEREAFFKMFTDNAAIRFVEAKHVKDADAYERTDLLSYNVVVLYDMPKTITDSQKARFLSLFNKGVGLVVLHHALASYQQWPEYERIIGGRYVEPDPRRPGTVTEQSGYEHDVDLSIVIAARDHPVTAGIEEFMIHDEIYWGFRVGRDVKPLITTTHPKSGKPLAWARTEKESRVVFIQLGHGVEAFENAGFRALLAQSIQWTAHRP